MYFIFDGLKPPSKNKLNDFRDKKRLQYEEKANDCILKSRNNKPRKCRRN